MWVEMDSENQEPFEVRLLRMLATEARLAETAPDAGADAPAPAAS